MTALYGVLGDPIVHSLSPVIHNGWMRDLRIGAEYLAMQVPAGEFEESMRTLTDRGAKGLNVTLPHKGSAAAYADQKSDAVRALDAANTLSRTQEGGWRADNTDIDGFQDHLFQLLDRSVPWRSVYVLGAGGAARAVVYALARSAARVTVCNRNVDRAGALIRDICPDSDHAALSLEAGLARLSDADLVVNTTAAGHQGAALDLPDGYNRLFYDISYGSAAQFILEPAARKGWRTADGLGMLVFQAARSFEIWFGEKPDPAAALDRCRRALELAS